MKAQDLTLADVVEFGEGRLSLHGRRLVLHDINAFAQFRKDLVEMVGFEQARRILTRFGFFWGHADAAAMTRIFKWDSLAEWIKAGPRMHSLQGVTRAVIDRMELDEAAGKIEMAVTWHDSGEVDEHLIAFGPAEKPICWMLVGYASGYASFCLGRNVYFIEQHCRGKGDWVCTAVGKDQESWGAELREYLPYFHTDDIKGTIRRLTEEIKQKNRELTEQRKKLHLLDMVEIRSEAFRKVVELTAQVARFDSSVLITGESGTGKEVLARYIHRLSPRAQGAFVAVNCGALPETLLESELFGHKAGAFTGALRDRVGLFEEAQGGTILLDEIGDVTPALQLKLLRVLQEKEVLRVGESRPRKIDARVMAATNRDLRAAIGAGRFREDLFYRLGVIEIEVPPLRQRPEDILPLARHFVGQLAGKLKIPNLRLEAACLDYLQGYSWPGNVRELENAIERAAILCRDGQILPEYLPPTVLHGEARGAARTVKRTLAQVEREHIEEVLQLTGGNRTRAAAILGISGATLWRKLKQTGG